VHGWKRAAGMERRYVTMKNHGCQPQEGRTSFFAQPNLKNEKRNLRNSAAAEELRDDKLSHIP